jgi:putative exosortase-associated protein (TIGR04073 family)
MRIVLIIFCALLVFLPAARSENLELAESHEDEIYGIDTHEINYENSALNKLGRGLINTATCWSEVPAKTAEVSKEKDITVGVTLGAAEGLVNGALRVVSGLYDTLTFMIPPYDKPYLKPEYALEDAEEQIKDYLW